MRNGRQSAPALEWKRDRGLLPEELGCAINIARIGLASPPKTDVEAVDGLCKRTWLAENWRRPYGDRAEARGNEGMVTHMRERER